MAKITSTERLLGVIRGGEAASGPDKALPGKAGGAPKAAPASRALWRARMGALFSGKVAAPPGKAVKVGADLGPSSLTLVKMARKNEHWDLLDFGQVPYPDPEMSFNSPEFVSFLRKELARFCGPAGGMEIWTLVSSANADLWHMRIPKVPTRMIPDTVYWAAKKEKQFDDAQFILDFEVQGEVMDKGVEKIGVMAYMAPRDIVAERKALFAAAGYPLTGATISPIALQTLFRSKWVPNTANIWANIFVGRNWSRIDVFDRGNLALSRAVKAGVNSMVETFQEGYNAQVDAMLSALDQKPAPASPSPAVPAAVPELDLAVPAPESESGPVVELEFDLPEIVFESPEAEPAVAVAEPAPESAPVPEAPLDEAPVAPPVRPDIPLPQRLDKEQARRILAHKLLGRPLGENRAGAELDEAEVFELMLPAVERLVRQVERTFEYHVSTMGNDRIEKLFFSGDICTNGRLIDYVDGQLGLDSQILDPLDPEIPWLLRHDVPESAADRLAYNLVIALALCDSSYTPNLLFTYKDKEQARREAMSARIIYFAAGACMALMLGFYAWNAGLARSRGADLEALRKEYEAFAPRIDDTLLVQMAAKARGAHEDLRTLARRSEGLALLREISGLTPENVRLLGVRAELGPPPDLAPKVDAKPKPAAPGQGSGKLLVLEGFIVGDEQTFDAALASYVVRLESSPLFAQHSVQKREVETLRGTGRVLRFVLHLNLV